LNHLLAWGHAVSLQTLLERFPECRQAIADKFGDERYILNQLKGKAKEIDLRQTPRAEANVGVAAASIVARWRFTKKIKTLSSQFGLNLPLGAGPQVKVAARKLIAEQGRDALAQVAKLHFKTTTEL
jgi:ribonuclease HIII